MNLPVYLKLKLLAVFCLLFITTGCTNLFFQPTKEHIVNPAQYGIEYQDVYFKSVDSLDLHGWWFPAQGESKAMILFLHGNGENISTHSSAVYWLTRHQYDVFIFDYRGYGLSQGVPDIDMAMTDIYQAFSYINKRNIKAKKIFIIGHSLGASLGIYSIAEKPQGIAGAIFVSPFSDYREIARNMLASSWVTWLFQWPLSLTVSNEYRPLDYVSRLPEIPILYLYSDMDGMVPADQIKALYENSNQPKYIEQVIGTHNYVLTNKSNREMMLRYLNDWLD